MKPTAFCIAAILFAGGCLLSGPACSRSEGNHDTRHGDHDDESGRQPDDHEDEQAGHTGPGEDAEVVQLRDHEIEEFGIEVAEAGPGTLLVELELQGEVQLDPDSLVHMTPRVPGIVREVHKRLGDVVEAGDLLAVLDSRELAEAKAAFLARGERLTLAASNLEREKYLYEREVSSEQDYLEARQAEAEARINLQSAEQRLHALGLSEDEITGLQNPHGRDLTRYEMRAPIAGTVVDKHITLGETLGNDSLAFVIADLSRVWVLLTVYQKDLMSVRPGQRVDIVASHDLAEAVGVIDFIHPILHEGTRTTTARIVLPNEEGRWRPGLFVTARVLVARVEAAVVVPRTAILTIEGQPVVFVLTDDGFVPRPVRPGRSDVQSVELLGGLRPGERYAAAGGFALKAELNKASFAGGGHAH